MPVPNQPIFNATEPSVDPLRPNLQKRMGEDAIFESSGFDHPKSKPYQVAPKAQLSVVPQDAAGSAEAGRVLVMGPFPPLIGAAAGHASALLHLFKETGYTVRSATGPGLALARHNVNFASETRLKTSSGFLGECANDDFAVIYAKSLDFAKVSKPLWYKRRLEELRRLRWLARVVKTYSSTTLVMEDRPHMSRYQISLWAVLRFFGKLHRKPVSVVHQNDSVSSIFQGLTGLKRPQPTAYRAEETAYEAAFNPDGQTPPVRLTVARAEQALNFWGGRAKDPEHSPTGEDLRALIQLAQRHDLHALPHFRLLWNAPDTLGEIAGDGDKSPGYQASSAFLDGQDTFGVPITRYMRHLWVSIGPHRRFRLTSRADAEKLLEWYLLEAPGRVPGRSVPLVPEVRRYYLEEMAGLAPAFELDSKGLVHARGRDSNPFALSAELATLANSDHPIAQKYDVDDPIDRLGFVLEFLLTQNDLEDVAGQIGQSAVAYLNAPIGGDSQNVSRLEFLMAVQARCQLEGRGSVELPWQCDAVRRFTQAACGPVFPGVQALVGANHKPPKNRPQFSISGLPKSETGVGSNLHMSLSALHDIGLKPEVFDTADGMRKLNTDANTSAIGRLKRPVALHHVNADLVPQSMIAPVFAHQTRTMHIGFLLWEFDKLPQSHRLALDILDEIWTPTEFLRDVYANASNKPVRNMLKGLHIPKVPQFDLGEIGVEEGCTTFLTCFDFHSSVARKNPLAAVQAFKNAFAKERRDVRLIVKTTPSVESHWGDPENQMRKIHQIAAADDRIVVVSEYYPFNRLLSLIAACDCLISPHRAEGFGLMPAYALGLGVAVMATDYSGTTDFCNDRTAMPIPFSKVQVERHQVLHPLRGATWAEIDRDALIAQMRDFVANPAIGRQRAGEGKQLILSKFSPEQQADRYRARLREIGVI